MVNVMVKPEILKWAVNRVGGAEKLINRFPKINKWLAMESQPTLKQLEKLAKATATPLGYFFLSEPPVDQIKLPYYRTVKDGNLTNPSVDLLETMEIMERRQEWMKNYLIELGNEPLPFVGSASLNDDPKKVAKEMKKILGIEHGWASKYSTWEYALRNLIVAAENIGILVSVNSVVGNNNHRKLEVNEFRGFVLVDEFAPLIFINGSDGKAAQMFTLAHEMAHIWYGESAIFDLRGLQPSSEKIEQLCNQTAAEFLVSGEELNNFWQEISNYENRFQIAAEKFKVSELVIARRALDLKLISKEDYFIYYNNRTIIEKNKSNNNKGNFYNTQFLKIGRRFASAVISSSKSGKILYQEAYRLTGLNRLTFDKFAQRIEEGGY